MQFRNRFFLSLISFLILGSTFFVSEIEASTAFEPAWEYVVPELDRLTLHGGLSQWSEENPIDIELLDMSLTGEKYQLQAFFGFKATELYIGLVIPKGDQEIFGVELIFFNEGVLDGIIVDTELQEARDVAYVNHTYVATDSELSGREDVSVAITDEGDNYFYMIVEETQFHEEDPEEEWVVSEGDSVAVVFQAWVNEIKDDVNRPNFSTAGPDFNYLRLSIKEDNGWLMNPSIPWDLIWEKSDLPEVSYHEREENITLDGTKNEDCWIQASSSQIKLSLVSKTAPTSLLNTADPSYIEATISFTCDKNYLYMFLEIPHENNDTNLKELVMVFGDDELCLQNLSAPLLFVKINPTHESYFRSGINAELRVPGIVPIISPDCYGVVSTVQTFGIQGLEYGSFRDFGPHGVENVETKLPLSDLTSDYFPSEKNPITNLFLYLAEWAIWVDDSDPSNPYDDYYIPATLEDEQLYFDQYKITFTNETSTPTRTVSFFSTTILFFLPAVWILTIRRRKLKK